jgi:predicted naringenin-chalcone synthase
MVSVYIHNIETIVPEHAYSQEYARERMKTWVDGDKERRLVHRVYRNSGIEARYSVLGDFEPSVVDGLFRIGADGKPVEPGTGARNERFAGEARRLSVELARRTIDRCPGIVPADITHVITATCTGFSNPGPDYHIMREANLPASTQRYALGFMGCYAALPALRMAQQFCRADPSAVVLIVCIELCTLHLHFEDGMDSLLANAIFADGAGAAIVSARQPAGGRGVYRLDSFASALIPGSEKDMAWRIGDKGFEIVLSTYVPEVIGANIRALVEPILASGGHRVEDMNRWAIHPGGKAILDKVQNELRLAPEQVHASREVMRKFGNMSSATLLFVLKELLDADPVSVGEERICAMAFGPGLTVEAAILGLVMG